MALTIYGTVGIPTIWLGNTWAFLHHAFINKGLAGHQVLFMGLNGFSPMAIQATRAAGITSSISTFIADSSLVGNKKFLFYIRLLIMLL